MDYLTGSKYLKRQNLTVKGKHFEFRYDSHDPCSLLSFECSEFCKPD